ncbi:hypothetical protein FG382_14150 [Psychrobacillus lasiicapitis]|uniref:Spermidine/putrescine ABC transporter ATP-binding protein n=1 Tax=Psychrobacillus lasiicapitis TaxID=1636719 RepID=A0A544T2U8_9BACI|nr:hypothetical protein FG382_14150 [Psychrobacillus lasiicapitis]
MLVSSLLSRLTIIYYDRAFSYFYQTIFIYPALTSSKTPTSRFKNSEKISGRSTARKSPIGSTNNQ